jgi:site-specific recombinase
MFMLKFLDALANRPSVWLTVFGCGSVMSIASVAQAFGVRAAGTVSGFLILSGAIGYEILSRQIESAALEKKLRQISQTQETISQEFDALRKNVPQADQNKKQTPPPPSASRPLGRQNLFLRQCPPHGIDFVIWQRWWLPARWA